MATQRRQSSGPSRRPKAKPLPRRAVDQQVAQLTRKILERLAGVGKQTVEAKADVGDLLLQVRNRLRHGSWTKWLQTRVPFTRRTAERAINLHRFRSDQPALFAKLAPLGVAKAQVLITLPPATRTSLLTKRQRVPSTGASKTIAEMTYAELMEVLAASSGSAPGALDALHRSYKRQVRALIRTLDDLTEHGTPALSRAQLEDLHGQLLQAAERFARALDIPDD